MTPPDHLLGPKPVRGMPATAEKLAVNAAIAGCLSTRFPVPLPSPDVTAAD